MGAPALALRHSMELAFTCLANSTSARLTSAESDCLMKTNSSIRLRKLQPSRARWWTSKTWATRRRCCVTNPAFVRPRRGMMKRGVIPQDEGWNGWLGKYQKALRETALALEQQ